MNETGNSPTLTADDALPMSFFEGALATVAARSISRGELLESIQSGKWRTEVAAIRATLAREGKKACNELKKSLPAVTISGQIDGARKAAAQDGRLVHTGLLQIDIDQDQNPGKPVSELKEICIASGFCIAAFESPSGTGVKALVRIEPRVETHAWSFAAAERHFAELGVTIDPSTKDPGRLMFVSSDPEIWIAPSDPPVILTLPTTSSPSGDAGDSSRAKKGFKTWDDADVSEMLKFIPPRPNYDKWIRISWAVVDGVGADKAIPILQAWSPEEVTGEYTKLVRGNQPAKRVKIGTLIRIARAHGYRGPTPPRNGAVPDDVIPMAGGGIGFQECATAVFESAAPTERLFIRERSVCEVVRDGSGMASISPVTPERMMELVETLGKRVAKREWVPASRRDGQVIVDERNAKWRTTTMTMSNAKVILQSSSARSLLPPLKVIMNSPVIVETEGGLCQILQEGYHSHGGGIFVTGSTVLEDFPGNYRVASNMLKYLLEDFDFATPADRSRAVASLISPALKGGNILKGDFPIDVAEADRSQSGKTYRQKVVAALYNETPSVITSRIGGVGSVDESVANALLSGRPFIALDNIRGAINSPLLEMALRGHPRANCRGFRAVGDVDLTPFIFQLSTNGAEFTRDLANRAVITRIRKRPSDYPFREYPSGDLLSHVRNRRGLFLASVFCIVREWVKQGKPQTREGRHDFREWIRSLDWIVQNLCSLPPLMDGHREEQHRTANPSLQWLREIVLAAQPDRHFGHQLTTAELLDIAELSGIDFPGGSSKENVCARAGKILGRLFNEVGGDTVTVDGYTVTRSTCRVSTPSGPRDRFKYLLSKLD